VVDSESRTLLENRQWLLRTEESTATFPLTVGTKHDRQHTDLAGTAAKHPAAPLVRDEGLMPAACPMGRSRERYHGHSRTTPQASQPGLTHVSRVAEET